MTLHRQTVAHLSVKQLVSHPGNLRNDLGDLTEMAMSIRENGILQPLIVTEHSTDAERHILLVGHRRLAAALLAGLTTVPVIIRHGVDDSDQIILMLVENIHRRELDPVERAEAYGALLHQGLTKVEIARRAGVVISNVSRVLALLDLPEDEREQIRTGELSAKAGVEKVRQTRQEQRLATGRKPMGTPAKAKDHKHYFGSAHRLAASVREICTHPERVQVGSCGCGPCWEEAIRTEVVNPALVELDVRRAQREDEIDEVAVERRMSGDQSVPLNPAERVALVQRCIAAGWTYNAIQDRTGVAQPQRYFVVEERAS